jgi:hypothetical protein
MNNTQEEVQSNTRNLASGDLTWPVPSNPPMSPEPRAVIPVVEASMPRIVAGPKFKPGNADPDLEALHQAFNYAWMAASSLPEDQRSPALRALACGSVKRSRVENYVGAVSSPDHVRRLVCNLAGARVSTMIHRTTGNIVHRYLVPQGYKAFTPYVRAKELSGKGDLFEDAIKLCRIRTTTGWEMHFHAPKIRVRPAEVITFTIEKTSRFLLEWHAGEDITIWPPNNELGSHWVYLGADLVQSTIRDRRMHDKPMSVQHTVEEPGQPV